MKYELCKYSNLESFDAYLASLSAPIDSFLEDHLLESEFYRIVLEGAEVGSFAIHNNALLTQFHVAKEARRHGQELFGDILEQYKLKAAFVPTCDEFFLSHALDKHTALKKQAFFFIDGGEQADLASKSPELAYRVAAPADIPALSAIKDSIIDNPEESIRKREAYVGYLNDKLVAVGLIVPSQLWRNQASIGMLTDEAHRQQGIGTQTIRYLKQVCRDTGMTPLAGCGYGNINSRMTLQAAGMVTATRLLKFTF